MEETFLQLNVQPVKPPMPRMGCIAYELLVKEVSYIPSPKTSQAIAKTVGSSLQPDAKGLLLKRPLTFYQQN